MNVERYVLIYDGMGNVNVEPITYDENEDDVTEIVEESLPLHSSDAWQIYTKEDMIKLREKINEVIPNEVSAIQPKP